MKHARVKAIEAVKKFTISLEFASREDTNMWKVGHLAS